MCDLWVAITVITPSSGPMDARVVCVAYCVLICLSHEVPVWVGMRCGLV